jgi:hypothetical protein
LLKQLPDPTEITLRLPVTVTANITIGTYA